MAGYYGKIPSHGDFVSVGLAAPFVRRWDAWLQEGLAASRTRFTDAWLDVYLTSPVWHFVLAPGACTEAAWAGVFIPSVDKVGRQFPLTLAQALAPDLNPVQVAAECGTWFDGAAALVLSVLETDFDREAFDTAVGSLVMPGLTAGGAAGREVLSATAWRLGTGRHGQLEPALMGVLQQLLRERMDSFALWWTAGSQRMGPALLISRGLPSAGRFPALLDGQWGRWDWLDGGEFVALVPSPTAPSEARA